MALQSGILPSSVISYRTELANWHPLNGGGHCPGELQHLEACGRLSGSKKRTAVATHREMRPATDCYTGNVTAPCQNGG